MTSALDLHLDAATAPLDVVGVDLYRDVHKGIRNELFAITAALGTTDPHDRATASAIAERIDRFFVLLHAHADHEDAVIAPVLVGLDPAIDERVRAEHAALASTMATIEDLGRSLAESDGERRSLGLRRWYLAFASFCGHYLTHEATEELAVAPLLSTALGEAGVVELERAIVGAISPDDFAGYLRLILPAANRPERAALVGGIRDGAPPEVLAATLGLARDVLTGEQLRGLEADLG